ncbi:MAG: hypothetical protein FWE21_06985 [Defluviitaleaceae bacterium]|nr:hypothetical protein [Defluviitaleaceae bacterium]
MIENGIGTIRYNPANPCHARLGNHAGTSATFSIIVGTAFGAIVYYAGMG